MMESASDYYDLMDHYELLVRLCEFILGHSTPEKLAITEEGRKACLRLRSRRDTPFYTAEGSMEEIRLCYGEVTQRIKWLEEIRDNLSSLSSAEIVQEMLKALPLTEVNIFNNCGIIYRYERPSDMGEEYLKSLLRRYLDYAIDKSKPILGRVKQDQA